MDTSCMASTGFSQSHSSNGATLGQADIGMDGSSPIQELGQFSDKWKNSSVVGQPIRPPQHNSGQPMFHSSSFHQHGFPGDSIEGSISSPAKLQDPTVASRSLFSCKGSGVSALEGWNTLGPGEDKISIFELGQGKQGSELRPIDLTKHSATNTSFSPIRASGHTHDHIMAERKRREKLTQRFIALSATVPDLKRTDKASILGDTIKYIKRLQERIKSLEEQIPKEDGGSKIPVKDKKKVGGSLIGTTEAGEPGCSSDMPEIEVRVVEKNVLIRIHCKKRKGILLRSVGELEKLELVILNANILTFTEGNFDFTFNAQMEQGLNLTADDIVAALQAVFFMAN